MKRAWRKITAIILSGALCVASTMPVLADSAQPRENLQSSYIKDIISEVAKRYRFEVSETEMYEAVMDYVMNENPELLEGAIRAATGSLDQYSGYMDREELGGFGDYIDQSYVGIGIEIVREPGYLEIVSVTMGSPAEAAGFQAGDRIVKIDGEDATDFSIDTAASKVRGEAGTSVSITVLRDGKELTLAVTRAKVAAATLHYEIADGVGYILLAKFNMSTPEELKAALSYFDENKIKNIIIDVRDNPGGELLGLLQVLYQLVPYGKKLTTIDYNGEERDITFSSKASFKSTNRRFAVLVNKNSASAAELFAGAIRDNKLGVLIGERTHGKGTVQEFMGLNSLGGLKLGDIKLTVAEYSLPNGEFIHKKGITPDIEVENERVPLVKEDFLPITFEAKYKVGDSGDAITAIEQRLDALGYQVGEIDGEFDEELELAVYSFQEDADLYPYGVMDITTQTFLNNISNSAQVLEDLQLEAAFSYFNEKAVK